MKYMGSKSRIKKQIIPIIQQAISDCNAKVYVEPFAGGMNIIDAIKADTKIASDDHKYLIALFQHLASGGKLFDSVDKELYDKARNDYRNQTNVFEDWELGNIGFLASYNGRWFDGGYAKSRFEKTKSGERYRDYYQEAKRNIEKQIPLLNDVIFKCSDYKEYSYLKGAVIYCDPPYMGTKEYSNSGNFNHEEFWETIRCWSKDNVVLVSEENAPDDFKVLWEKEVTRSIKAQDKSKSNEKLFVIR